MKTKNKILFFQFAFKKIYIINLSIFLLLCSCSTKSDNIRPNISYLVTEKEIQQIPAAFKPLITEEKKEDWGKEYLIAITFAKNLDLYRAISTFKRAEILIPSNNIERKQEIQYNILFCYFLGKKYEEVIETFEKSLLPQVDNNFSTFHDLLVILYESYSETKQKDKAYRIQKVLSSSFPITNKKLDTSIALKLADIEKLKKKNTKELTEFLSYYNKGKKSSVLAQTLNAIIPGFGYLYLGQKKSAVTSFILNSSFITASYQFFKHRYIAAGIITTSLELGWYIGGIYGAAEQTKYYNECIYEQGAVPFMKNKKLFPFFMLNFSF